MMPTFQTHILTISYKWTSSLLPTHISDNLAPFSRPFKTRCCLYVISTTKSPFQHFQVFLQKNLLSWLRCCARRCTSWPFLLSGRQRRIDYVIIRAKQTRTHKDLLHFLTFDQIKVFLKMSCLDFFDARESKWVKRPCQRALCFCQKNLKVKGVVHNRVVNTYKHKLIKISKQTNQIRVRSWSISWASDGYVITLKIDINGIT